MPSYIGKATDAFFDAINTGSSIVKDYTENEARFATTTKKYNLQADINNEMQKIAMNGNYTTWQTDINNFFEKVKGQMSDPNSQYYCKNNLQAKMFNEVLNDSLVSVGNRVSMMVMQKQLSQMGVDRDQAINRLIEQGITGNDFVQKANEIDEAYWMLNGNVDPDEKQAVREKRYIYGYTSEKEALFNNTLDEAIKRGDSAEKLINMVDKNTTPINASNADGSPMAMDTKGIDADLDKKFRQKYDAALKDYQQENANKLSRILEQMRQVNTAEEKVQIAQHGQNTMKLMKDHDLSENDRNFYSAAFELNLGGSGLKGSGSGSGSSKPTDSYENLIKSAPDTALQLWLDGKHGNVYDVTQTVSNAVTEQWFTKPYKENFGKDDNELKEDFSLMYQGRVSSENITDAITKKILEKFPSAKNYIDNNFKNLITDMQKNPKKYGTATAGELANFMLDTIYSADSSYTDEDFMNAFKQHVNDCYVERIKYVELDKKGNLEKKFNANKEKDIAQAARLASEKDFVYTFNGNEVWAPGKKEALEAEGGIVDVLKSAVAGTLDIPAEDRSLVGFQYVQSKDDMTSQPIITYKNQAYEVIPNDDDKGFKLREVHTGEVIEGKLAGNGKAERKEDKTQAKENVKNAHNATYQLESERTENVNKSITEKKDMPYAMKKAGGVKDAEWENGTLSDKQIYLQDNVTKINKAADAVKNKKMTEAQFYDEYHIKYDKWINTKEKIARFNLILES
jgi:hypothetical protein